MASVGTDLDDGSPKRHQAAEDGPVRIREPEKASRHGIKHGETQQKRFEDLDRSSHASPRAPAPRLIPS